jgi:hypothetical protein
MAETRCLRCGYRITWAEQRRQFARLMRKGSTHEAATSLMPRCQVCLTATLRGDPIIGIKPVSLVSEVSDPYTPVCRHPIYSKTTSPLPLNKRVACVRVYGVPRPLTSLTTLTAAVGPTQGADVPSRRSEGLCGEE